MPVLPEAILFDLDDTLISAYGRPGLAWSTVVGEFAAELAPLATQNVVAAIRASGDAIRSDPERHRAMRRGLPASRRDTVAGGFERLAASGHAVPPVVLQHRIADRFTAYREENMELFPDALATIAQLRMRGVKLALLTNGAGDYQRAKILRFDLAHRFDHIQIEGEHGFGKPEECAYVHAMQTLGVVSSETWIVGDNLDWEVIAPQKLGIHAIWYDPHGDGVPAGHAAKPDRIIRRLTELLG
ncbi:MAG: HAD family hydrolase [Rhizomicrobium sp.]